MGNNLFKTIKELPRLKLLILIFAIWQYASILGMSIFHWPDVFIWLNLGLLSAFVILSSSYESLLLLILSIPFFVALPNFQFSALSMWRPLFLLLFFVWLIRDKKMNFYEIKFLPWDKLLGLFLFVGIIITLFSGRFIGQGFKQVLFWLNIYCLYLVLINTLKNKEQILELIRYVIWSLAIIVTLGFTQLFGTFFTNLDVFWVYWASNVTKLFYGESFALVSLYSNSWFSYSGGRGLRMFSIMPDSQSFAYICIFSVCLGTALTHNVFKYVKKWLWSGIRFASLGLILSGTRAAWVGMIIPFFAVIWAYIKNFQTHLSKKFIWPFFIIFSLFAISPFINAGLNYLRINAFKEEFLSRVESIYNLQEPSNLGRLKIWRESLAFAAKHPFGVGFGNFIVSLESSNQQKSYQNLAGEINERYNLPQRYVSAHNLYLQVLVETGILGLLLFIGFWLVVIRAFWRFIKHYKNAEDFLVYFVAQALLMVLWILGASFFDITLLNDKVLMFFFLDIGLAGLIVKKYHEFESNL